MRIIVGSFYHEATTFNPFLTEANDFTLVEGEESINYLAGARALKRRGAEVIPTIFASAISSGSLKKDAYRYFANKMLEVFKKEKNIDGIWMHLHGAMDVEGIGSGEAALLREIREIVGYDIPISLAMDLHGNIDEDVPKLTNIIQGYRTAPHIDRDETEVITADLLMDSLQKGTKHKPTFKRIPMIIQGEKALSDKEPMISILNKLREYESMEGILVANYFNGHAWTDAPNVSASVIVVPESEKYEELADKVTNELADFIYSLRHEFKFDALTLFPKETIDRALSEDKGPIFISDAGDNTTGGAPGINTVLLRILKEKDLGDKKVLVSSIFDKESYERLNKYSKGDQVTVEVGIGHDKESAPIMLEGILKAKGDLLGFATAVKDKVGEVCTISVGNLDVVIANRGDSFVSINHFTSAGLNIHDYDIIVVKQGYLFDELASISEMEILCLSPGATYQLIEELEFNYIQRPMYPLD